MGCLLTTEQDHSAVAAQAVGVNETEQAVAAVLGSTGLATRIELSISCAGLKNMDYGMRGGGLDKSDPMVVVYELKSGSWVEVGRTEVICNQLDPRFVKTISLTYLFEEVQQLGFKVYDVDSGHDSAPETIDLSKQDYLGECSCHVAQIMGGSASQTVTMQLTKRGKAVTRWGTMTVAGEEIAGQNGVVNMRFRAEGLDRKDIIGSSDPFLKLSRLKEGYVSAAATAAAAGGRARGAAAAAAGAGAGKTPCYRTEVRRRTLNPNWDVISINIQQLCSGDIHRPILIECWDWDADGSHDFIGSCELSLDNLMAQQLRSNASNAAAAAAGGGGRGARGARGAAGGPGRIPLINPRRRSANKVAGQLVVEYVEVVQKPSFLDYIAGGTEVSFMVAIDFTASNGPPQTPNSLHYVDPTGMRLNSYQQAIVGVGQVLEFYDSDRKYPVWGFGGRAANGVTNHCFALNGTDGDPEVEGIQGIFEAYSRALSMVQLSGPTIFSQVVNTAAAIADSSRAVNPYHYHILLIITDGIINDMNNTISAIIRAANLPLSILIVGVGNADFKAMDVLDGDEVRLANETGVAARDIVQFVPFRDFVQPDGSVQPSRLASALLEEIPMQLISYFDSQQLPPPPRVQQQSNNPMADPAANVGMALVAAPTATAGMDANLLNPNAASSMPVAPSTRLLSAPHAGSGL